MKAWLFKNKDDPGGWTDIDAAHLPDEPVHVRVTHSGLNYKDALALTRSAPIARAFPMVPGIDLVGTVIADSSGTFSPGEHVVATGHALGEKFWGAYSQEARLKPEWLRPLPPELSPEHAAAFGTAGVTAALCIAALERHGITADQGSVLLTGASGGVGTFASLLLKQAGYTFHAATGRVEEADYLRQIGAAEIIDRTELESDPKPLNQERWCAAIDVAGGKVLANILSSIQYGGAVAACGLASSMDLPTSVAPFILRGISLLGIDSVKASAPARDEAWKRLSTLAPVVPFDRIVTRHNFSEALQCAKDLLAQKARGKAVFVW